MDSTCNSRQKETNTTHKYTNLQDTDISSTNCEDHKIKQQHSASLSTNQIEATANSKIDEDIKKPTDFNLDIHEVNKLFGIIVESDSSAFSDIFGHERLTIKPFRRFSPYPIHHQLFIQQQQEQERRRQSLTTVPFYRNVTVPRDIYDYKNRDVRYMYSSGFRNKIVQKIIGFIDSYSTKIVSDCNDISEKCVICMYNYQTNQSLRKLNCDHKFHRKCIDEWLVKSYECPVCRKDLTGTGKAFKGIAVLYHMWKQEKEDNVTVSTNISNLGQNSTSSDSNLQSETKNQIPTLNNSSNAETSEINEVDRQSCTASQPKP